MPIDFGQRYVTKGGNDSNDGLTIETSKLTVRNAMDSLPTAGGVPAGSIFVGKGTFVETSLPLPMAQEIHLVGMNAGFGAGNTIIKQGAANHLIEWPATWDSWAHNYSIENIELQMDTASFPGNYDICRILRPGFQCRLRGVRFNKSDRYGLVVCKGSDFLDVEDCGWTTCDVAAVRYETGTGTETGHTGGSMLGFISDTWRGLQIDSNVAPRVFEIEQQGFLRSTIDIDGIECESYGTTAHARIISLIQDNTNSRFRIGVKNVHIIDGSGGSGKIIFDETEGTQPGAWVTQNVNCSQGEFTHQFKGIDQTLLNTPGTGTDSDTSHSLAIFGREGDPNQYVGQSRIVLGNIWLCSGSGAPTFTAPMGSHYSRADSAGEQYKNTDGGTTWVAL